MTWNEWLSETVCWDADEYITRQTAIYRLCKYGLIPFFEANGYVISIKLETLCSRIATGLYNNQYVNTLDSNWTFGPIENTVEADSLEHLAHYNHVMPVEEWEHFWAIWGVWPDVCNKTNYGWDRQNDIRDYMWTQLSLEESPQTQVVNELLCIDEGGAVEQDRRDAYIRDISESNEWGGRR
jgi:hypothetical protein